MLKPFFRPYFILTTSSLFIILFICMIAVTATGKYTFEISDYEKISICGSTQFAWPTPGYTTITSPFGRRNAPTAGASSIHSGIDIGAPTGSNIIAACSGEVIFIGFSGAGGYTITIEGETFTASYCHVSPNFQVYIGQKIRTGQVIGKVGPRNVYGVSNNPYKDENGKPTNRGNNRPTSAFDAQEKWGVSRSS